MSQSSAITRFVVVTALFGLVAAAAGCGLDPLEAAPPEDEGLPEPASRLSGDGVAPLEQEAPATAERDDATTGQGPDAQPPYVPADLTGCEQVRVVNTGTDTLNVRPDPSTAHASVGHLSAGQVVDTIDIVDGESVNGDDTWYEIDTGSLTGFISGAFADCVDPNAPPPPPPGYLLPLTCGAHVTVTQGNNTTFSHNGSSAYAFDFGLALNTPLHAVHAGTVKYKDTSTQPGDPCYSGGDSSCINEANYVVIDNGDGTRTIYAHINSSTVHVGDHVARGQEVAKSGGTGWSTGPHAHVARTEACGSPFCQSVPMHFGDVSGDGVPVSGEHVVSQNCP